MLFTVRDSPLSVLVTYLFDAYSFLIYPPHGVEVLVVALKDAHDETVTKRFAIASNGITTT